MKTINYANRYPTADDQDGIYFDDGTQPYIDFDSSSMRSAIDSFTATYDFGDDLTSPVEVEIEALGTEEKQTIHLHPSECECCS